MKVQKPEPTECLGEIPVHALPYRLCSTLTSSCEHGLIFTLQWHAQAVEPLCTRNCRSRRRQACALCKRQAATETGTHCRIHLKPQILDTYGVFAYPHFVNTATAASCRGQVHTPIPPCTPTTPQLRIQRSESPRYHRTWLLDERCINSYTYKRTGPGKRR